MRGSRAIFKAKWHRRHHEVIVSYAQQRGRGCFAVLPASDELIEMCQCLLDQGELRSQHLQITDLRPDSLDFGW